MEPTPKAIAKLAYQFYVEDGKPEGLAEEHWLRAEAFLRHPEDHSEENVLSPPSEPEMTRALDEKARDLDLDLPSDPHSGADAVHQRVDLVIDKKDMPLVRAAMRGVKGVERVDDSDGGRVAIYFDARRTNPAAIHEAILEERQEAVYRSRG